MPNLVTLCCSTCKTFFTRRRAEHNYKLRQGKTKVFCSKKCNAINSFSEVNSKPKLTNFCKCGKQIQIKSKHCHNCNKLMSRSSTLQDLRINKGTSNYHRAIRGFARADYKGPMTCAACGYSLHVDICHIRPVQDFPLTATIAEVNNQNNLVALDKRCHWEFDNGFLTYDVDSKVWKMV